MTQVHGLPLRPQSAISTKTVLCYVAAAAMSTSHASCVRVTSVIVSISSDYAYWMRGRGRRLVLGLSALASILWILWVESQLSATMVQKIAHAALVDLVSGIVHSSLSGLASLATRM